MASPGNPKKADIERRYLLAVIEHLTDATSCCVSLARENPKRHDAAEGAIENAFIYMEEALLLYREVFCKQLTKMNRLPGILDPNAKSMAKVGFF